MVLVIIIDCNITLVVLDGVIHCSGWSYSSWQGPFYPLNIENSQWLIYYSQVFDFVEIDSTFYRMPNPFMVKNWYKRTPDNFRFTAKFPKIITHDKRLKNVQKELEYFLESISGLEEKILALLIQLPPSLRIAEGIEGLRESVYHEIQICSRWIQICSRGKR